MADNKIKYGLKNAHYALIEESAGKIVFGTPVPLNGAVSMALSPVGETTAFYADNEEYFSTFANNGYDGTLELAKVNDQFLVDVLGEELDTNNVQFEKNDALPKAFALLWEFSGDQKATRHVAYYCKCARPNIEGNTKGASLEVKTETLNLTIRSIPGEGIVKSKTTATTDAEIYEKWYEAVYKQANTPV